MQKSHFLSKFLDMLQVPLHCDNVELCCDESLINVESAQSQEM